MPQKIYVVTLGLLAVSTEPNSVCAFARLFKKEWPSYSMSFSVLRVLSALAWDSLVSKNIDSYKKGEVYADRYPGPSAESKFYQKLRSQIGLTEKTTDAEIRNAWCEMCKIENEQMEKIYALLTKVKEEGASLEIISSTNPIQFGYVKKQIEDYIQTQSESHKPGSLSDLFPIHFTLSYEEKNVSAPALVARRLKDILDKYPTSHEPLEIICLRKDIAKTVSNFIATEKERSHLKDVTTTGNVSPVWPCTPNVQIKSLESIIGKRSPLPKEGVFSMLGKILWEDLTKDSTFVNNKSALSIGTSSSTESKSDTTGYDANTGDYSNSSINLSDRDRLQQRSKP